MAQRPNPISIEVLGNLNYAALEEDFNRLVQRIQRDDGARQRWIHERKELYKLTNGEDRRLKKPWPGASEIHIPLIKKQIRRWLPVVYNLIAQAQPVCHFFALDPRGAAVAPTVEEMFTWLIRIKMDDTLDELAYFLNDVAHTGCGYLAVNWKYETELETRVAIIDNLFPEGLPNDLNAIVQRLVQEYELTDPKTVEDAARQILDGRRYVKLTYRRVISDRPQIRRYHPFDVIVPPNSEEPERADYVCLVHRFTADGLRKAARDGYFDSRTVEAFLEAAQTEAQAERGQSQFGPELRHVARQELQQLQGISTIDSALFEVHQVYCWLDINGDGVKERCILWYVKTANGGHRLALYEFPFSFHHWPVFRYDFEKVDRRPYMSKGIAGLLADLQKEITRQHRARLDAIAIQLAPVFKMRVTSTLQPRSIRWAPGTIIPVTTMDDFQPVEKAPFNLHEYLGEEAVLKSFADELIGSIDAALSATGRRLERRTAFEVQAVAGQIEMIQAMDSSHFQRVMRRVFETVWQMWLDFGPEEIYYNVTGTPLPKLVKKSEINHRFNLVPAGTPGNINRVAELGRAIQAMQVLLQDQSGIVDRYALYRWFLSRLDPRLPDLVLRGPEEQQMVQQLAQVASLIASGKVPESMKAALLEGGLNEVRTNETGEGAGGPEE